jgi:hypothetical protein
VSPDPPEARVSFGDDEWVPHRSGFTTSIRDLPTAEFELRWGDVKDRPPDFSAPVTLRYDDYSAFSGNVLTVEPAGDVIKVECGGGRALQEKLMPIQVSEEVLPQELIYAAARGAGYDQDHMDIHGLERLPSEPIEVAVAIEGIEVTRSFGIYGVTFRPASDREQILRRFRSAPPDLVAALEAADAFAVLVRDGRLLWDVEQAALHAISVALAWMATRVRYGQAVDPYGAPEPYSRDAGRAWPMIGGAVTAQGRRTRRRWLRDPNEPPDPTKLSTSQTSRLLGPAPPDTIPDLLELALLRARTSYRGAERDRVVALFEAWEFYAGLDDPPPTFSGEELDRLREELPDRLPAWLSGSQRDRISDLLDLANNASLKTKMKRLLGADGVPVSQAEWKVLGRLRRARNQLAHGRDIAALDPEDLEWGCSLLSRALVHRMAREAAKATS